MSEKLEATVVARQVEALDCHSSTGWLLHGAEDLIHFTSKITKLLLLLSVMQLSAKPAHIAGMSWQKSGRVCINYSCKHSVGATGRCWTWFACPRPPRALLTAPKGASQTSAARTRYAEAAAACGGANMSFLARVGISLLCFSRCSVVVLLTPASGFPQKCCCLLCSVCPPKCILAYLVPG